MEKYEFSYVKCPYKLPTGWTRGSTGRIDVVCYQGRTITLEELAHLIEEAMQYLGTDIIDNPFVSSLRAYYYEEDNNSYLHLITRGDDATGPVVTLKNGMFWTIDNEWHSDDQEY